MSRKTELLQLATHPRIFLLLVAAAYVFAYLGHGATPGNSAEHPLGWWGWFDQGNYLNAAKAFAAFDFSPERHFYPPLYPLLGTLFLGASALHPFWLIDLVCLLWFAWSFVQFAKRHIPRWLAMAIFLLTVVASRTLFENFVIPWTTTLSAALLSVGIHALGQLSADRRDSELAPHPPSMLFIGGTSLALGLIAALRPIDALVGGVLWLGLLAHIWRSCGTDGHRFRQSLLIAIPAIAIGPLLFMGFNQGVFGSPLGGYIRANSSNGYFPADIAEKFVSLFLDGNALYLEPQSALLDHYPWLALALPALVFALARGNWALRVVAAAICLQFALYLPYGDLLPNGLWRYLNIHYFKWTFPYLALFVCYAGMSIFQMRRTASATAFAWLGFFICAVVVLASLRTEVDTQPLPVKLAQSHGSTGSPGPEFVISIADKDIDLIDFKGLQGGFNEIYFGEHQLTLDNRALQRVRDYRVLPAASGVRILFIRPVRGHSVVFRPDPRLTLHKDELAASSGSYRFILGQPKPFWNEMDATPASLYTLGTTVEFSSSGKGAAYARTGWSHPEDWGRWSTDDQASLRFKIQPSATEVHIELRLSAYVNERHPTQRIIVEANGNEVKRLLFDAASGGGDPRRESFTVPLDAHSELKLVLRTPDSTSPLKLGMSGDKRTLGVSLISLVINP